MTEFWNKDNPKKSSSKLSDSQKSDAKARAKAAGRPYPNLVDNAAVAKKKTKNEEVAEIIRKVVKENWQNSKYKNEKGGLTQAGVDQYRKENPGSKLKTAVTKKPSELKKGSKDAKRRESFCARMKGMKEKLTGSEGKKDPNSRINKSLRQWNCS